MAAGYGLQFRADIAIKHFLTLRAEYYIQKTDNLLSDVSLPASTGFANYKENLGVIENKCMNWQFLSRRGGMRATNLRDIYSYGNA